MDIIFGILEVSQRAAIAASKWIGRGDEKQADFSAVESMRKILNQLEINGEVVIGEGERDEAPMLYIGEKLGKGGVDIDIAVDPLEGTTLCAKGHNNSLTVIAVTNKGKFLNAPDVYMDKIAIGPGYPEGIIDLGVNIQTNLREIAKFKKCDITDLGVMVLERERHMDLIQNVRETGARLHLINDGDISAVIATTKPELTSIDLYVGSGGAPEGVLAAAALRAIGGQIIGQLIFKNDNEKERARKIGITDFNKKYRTQDLADGEIIFVASGVTDGWMMEGVKKNYNKFEVSSLILDAKNKKSHLIKTILL